MFQADFVVFYVVIASLHPCVLYVFLRYFHSHGGSGGYVQPHSSIHSNIPWQFLSETREKYENAPNSPLSALPGIFLRHRKKGE